MGACIGAIDGISVRSSLVSYVSKGEEARQIPDRSVKKIQLCRKFGKDKVSTK